MNNIRKWPKRKGVGKRGTPFLKTTLKFGGSMRHSATDSDSLQAGRIYRLDKRQAEGMTHKAEILEIRRTKKVPYGYMILVRMGNSFLETFTVTQAMDCHWKEDERYSKFNEKNGRGGFLDVRAMPTGLKGSNILLYKEWKKKEDLRRMQKRGVA